MRIKVEALALAVVAVLTVAVGTILGMHLDAQRQVAYEDRAVRFSRDWVAALLDADEDTINRNVTKMLERTDPAKRDHVNEIINLNLDLCKQNRQAPLVVTDAGIMTIGNPHGSGTLRTLVTTHIQGTLTAGPILWLDIVNIDGTPDVSDLGPL